MTAVGDASSLPTLSRISGTDYPAMIRPGIALRSSPFEDYTIVATNRMGKKPPTVLSVKAVMLGLSMMEQAVKEVEAMFGWVYVPVDKA